MTVEVRVPALGESVTEATIATWFKKPGDAVAVDEILCELETDKVSLDVPSPAAGILGEIVAQEGETVAAAALLATITEGAGGAVAPSAKVPEPAPVAAPARLGEPGQHIRLFQCPRRLQRQQTCHVDFHPRVGDLVDVTAQARQRFAECSAAHRPFAHQFQGPFSHADRAHAVVNPAWAKATLSDFEATAFTEQDVFVWHTHVVEQHFGVAVRSVIVAKHR